MLVILDRPRLMRLIAIVRDDRTPESQTDKGPFLRLEASDDSLKLTGRIAEATFPATVLEPGVLFLRITKFRRALRMLRGEKSLTIQANADGLMFGYIRMPLETNDMLLYADPKTAPALHPLERLEEEQPPPEPGAQADPPALTDPGLPLFPELPANPAPRKANRENTPDARKRLR